jgi:hypothetical protein
MYRPTLKLCGEFKSANELQTLFFSKRRSLIEACKRIMVSDGKGFKAYCKSRFDQFAWQKTTIGFGGVAV